MIIYNMKKRALFVSTILLLILVTSLAVSQETTEIEKVDEAYQCLEDRVDDCSSLSLEEKIFSLLAINKCKTDVIEDSRNTEECWPSSGCEIKTTAQAILALDNSNSDTTKAEDWLLSQNRTPTELSWYLEIESPGATTCSISYSGSSYNIRIGEDKKISNGAGSCLALAQDNYWLRISPSCYLEEFEISCDEGFLTTLLFKKATSSTIHVSEKTSSAAAGGTTKEKIDSFCFEEGGSCDYEGSLWAALVLDSVGRDVSSYLPYLVTLTDENERHLPEAFLYFLTSKTEYRNNVLSKQKSNKWWEESGDKFYDTALALYPFQQESPQEKTDSKSWLLDVQDADGCWERNTRNTAFILASIWPKDFRSSGNGGEGGLPDCEDVGYYCMSGASCEGDIFADYDCPALFKCCSVQQKIDTCFEMNGEVCSSNEVCRGTSLSAADTSACCVQGICEVVTTQEVSDCEINNGVCRSYSCDSNEEEAFYTCDISGDTCCVLKTGDGDGSFWWVWVLLILIILVIIGIIFREKLKDLLLRFQTKRRPKSRRPFDRPRPGPTPPLIHPRPMQRRILPPSRHTPTARPRRTRTSKELDDVLKKLKDLGK